MMMKLKKDHNKNMSYNVFYLGEILFGLIKKSGGRGPGRPFRKAMIVLDFRWLPTRLKSEPCSECFYLYSFSNFTFGPSFV